MTIDTSLTTDEIAAEIAEIDVLLMQYDDWRALQQLEAREQHGDGTNSASLKRLKSILIQSLSTRTLFVRRQQLAEELEVRAIERRAQSVKATVFEPVAPLRARSHRDSDDLTRIGGIDTRLERRLNVLNVFTYAQVANWTPADVHYVSTTLGLHGLVESQMWIEQARRLIPKAAPSELSVRATVSESVRNDRDHEEDLPPAPAPAHKAPKETVAAAAAEPTADATAKPAAPQKAEVKPPAPDFTKLAAQSIRPTPEAKKAEMPSASDAAVPSAKTEAPAAEKPAVVEVKADPPPKAPPPQPVQVDDSWKKLAPALPRAARHYSPPPDVIKAEREAIAAAAAALAIAARPLNPAKPLAARTFAGAVLEAHDDGSAYQSLQPAKPLPASAFKAPAPPAVEAAPPPPVAEFDASQLRPPMPIPARAVRPIFEAAKKPEPVPPAVPKPAIAVAQPVNAQARAAEILTHVLPPLPLRPVSAPAAAAPPPALERAAAAAAAAAPQIKTSAVAVAPPIPSEEGLLAAAARRAPGPVLAAPPPLPAASSVPPDVLAAAASAAKALQSRAAPPRPEARDVQPPRDFVRENGEVWPQAQQHEARVTIKRNEDTLPAAASKSQNGSSEIYKTAKRPPDDDEIDSASYAAYHGNVEEASVQIVRRPPAGIAPPPAPPAAPSLMSATRAAAAAAQQLPAAARPELRKEQAPPSPMGRFLKALTGQ